LNPIVLIRTTEVLSDLLSAVLLALSLFVSLERPRPARRALLAFLALGLSIAVRPANLAVLPALGILWIIRGRLYRERFRNVLLPAAAALALALAPQLHSNVQAYDAWNPLLVDRLYASQVNWGTAILKYGTIVAEGVEPQLLYRNPFSPPGVWRPREFLARSPAGYLKTLALHGFALVDQDPAFTYIQTARPWFRWPLSLLNYAFLFLALFGLATGFFDRREAAPRLYFAGAWLVSLAYVAVYLPVAVENRFSTPLYLVLAPAVVAAVDWLSRRRSGTVVAVAIAGGGFVAVCVQLSLWLSRQAPALTNLAGR
jgi:4-amino-4-deoxy-L-arabinose transferase-like glycosyltransferase